MPTIESYGIDGAQNQANSNEPVARIPNNRILITGQFTRDLPDTATIVQGLTDLQQVFDHYSPVAIVRFQSDQGKVYKEEFRFRGISDFSIEAIQSNSAFISNLKKKKALQQYIIKELKTNHPLQQTINTTEKRKELLQKMKQELAALG